MMMAKFVKPFDDSPIAITNSGYLFENVYTQRYDKAGVPYLEKIGEKNIVALIQSNKDNANYEKLIRKFQATGDISFLNGKEGFYADITGIPSNLIQAYDSIERAKVLFEQLDKEQRAAYDNSFTKFLADFGSESFMKAIGLEKVEPVTESEVKSDVAE